MICDNILKMLNSFLSTLGYGGAGIQCFNVCVFT